MDDRTFHFQEACLFKLAKTRQMLTKSRHKFQEKKENLEFWEDQIKKQALFCLGEKG